MHFRQILLLSLLWLPATQTWAQVSATININAGVTIMTFQPISIFGNNVAYWINKSDNLNAQPKVQAAGNYFLRYPGGSSSDDFHWNGNGAFDGNAWWTPSNSAYTSSFSGNESYRGTTSSYGTPSNLTDGNNATVWKSHPDTDFPHFQWVYVDLGSNQTVNSVTLVWGIPYATAFTVQYWDTAAYNQWSPYQDSANHWFNTSAAGVVGLGGTQGDSFTPVTTRYLRILMTSSSAGATGAYSIAELKVFNGTTQLTSNTAATSGGQPLQSWAYASSTDPASSLSYTPGFDFESYMTYVQSFAPQAIPLITINFGTGTPQEAAAWVHYANIVKGYGIKYWEIGNETHGDWETGGVVNAMDYGRRYIEFYEAMKAEDPSIIIAGPVAGSPYSSSNNYDNKTYIQGFVDRLASDPGGNKASYAEGIDFHWYPFWPNNIESTSLATPGQMAALATTDLPAMLANLPTAATVPILMTEFNSGGPNNFTVRIGNGLWLANWLGEFIRYFGNRGFSNYWDTLNGGDAVTSPAGSDHAYLQVEAGPYQYQERADYWAMQLMTSRWALPGSSQTHGMLSATSSQSLLVTYAVKRPDNKLGLVVINKDPANSYNATLNFSGFAPNASANRWTFDSTNYAWESAAAPYHASPDTAPTNGTQTGISTSFSKVFAPYSITVFQLTDSSLATDTPTASPTATPTATITMTPTITDTPTITTTPSVIEVLYPNPVRDNSPVNFVYQLDKAADQVRVSLFTVAARKIYEDATLPVSPGQHLAQLDFSQANLNVSNGLYYVVLWVKSGGNEKRKILKLLVQK